MDSEENECNALIFDFELKGNEIWLKVYESGFNELIDLKTKVRVVPEGDEIRVELYDGADVLFFGYYMDLKCILNKFKLKSWNDLIEKLTSEDGPIFVDEFGKAIYCCSS